MITSAQSASVQLPGPGAGRSFFWYIPHSFSSPLSVSPPLSLFLIQFYLKMEVKLGSMYPKRSPLRMGFSMSLCVCFTAAGRGENGHKEQNVWQAHKLVFQDLTF